MCVRERSYVDIAIFTLARTCTHVCMFSLFVTGLMILLKTHTKRRRRTEINTFKFWKLKPCTVHLVKLMQGFFPIVYGI